MSAPAGLPGEPGPSPPPLRFKAHGHLWALWDGTPAHAPPGRLVHDPQGRIACHLCGRWFEHLGLHLRQHGWSVARYREAVGLAMHTPLCSSTVSDRISARQRRRFASDPELREQLAAGTEMARSGELNAAAASAAVRRRAAGQENPGTAERRRAAGESGRRARARNTEQRVSDVVAAGQAGDLHELLRGLHAAGASVEQLRRICGLGRDRLRTEMRAAGIEPRRTGCNDPQSRRRRAERIDATVAARLGVDDVPAWLAEQRAAGDSMAALAQRTGRSVAWIRARLNGRTTTTPTTRAR